MKFAVIGCGYWGPNLVRNFNMLAECDELVCCDADPDKLTRIERLYPGVVTTSRAEDVFEDTEIEAVAIATPVRTHYDLTKRCLEAGKHVLVEKPMAATKAECVELIDLARSSELVLMIGHTFEYSVAVNKMKEIIDSGELGEIFYLSFQRLNLGPYRSDVNVIWDLAAHDVSILQYLLESAPVGVNAQGQAFLKKDNEDVATATLHFPSGVVAFLNDSWLDPHKVRRATVVGSRKMLVYDDVSIQEKIKIFDKGIDAPREYNTFGEFHFAYRYGDIHTPRIEDQEPLQVQCQHFVDCIRDRSAARSDGRSGARVVCVLEAISESMKRRGDYVTVDYGDVGTTNGADASNGGHPAVATHKDVRVKEGKVEAT